MRPRVTMRNALADPALLGHVLVGNSWRGWKILLIAAAGEKLDDAERIEFQRLTNREREPGKMVRELVGIFGRRAGKSLAMAVFICWIAGLCDHRAMLAPGEVGVALCISRDQRISKIILNYIDGILKSSEYLKTLIVNRTQETIELSNSISIEVRPANYRTLRGPTYIVIVCDEIAQWFTSVDFANPDVEVIASVVPGLKTTHGPLLLVSSAYSQHGVLYDRYKRYFGPSGPPDVLVAYGSSRDMNPSLSQQEIDRDIAEYPVRYRAEYLSEFRIDRGGFIDREVVEQNIGDYYELPPMPGISYQMFVDSGSGVPEGDSYCAGVSHKDGPRTFIDALREVRAPFSPAAVVADIIVPLARQYGISKVWGDAFAGNFAREPFRKAGLQYELCPKHRSEIYRDPMLPMLNSKLLVLPRNDRAINQICTLERTITRSGKEDITHPTYGHDDLANVIAGCAEIARSYGSYMLAPFASDYVDPDSKPAQENPPEADVRLNNFYRNLSGAFGPPSKPAAVQWPRRSTNNWPW